jgi:hypothetical protein
VEDSVGLSTISAVYLPPRHTVKQEQFDDVYNNLGQHFIAGGDYNAKHTDWGYTLISFKGHKLLKMMDSNSFKHLSMGELNYWPSDRNNLLDLAGFCVTKGTPQDFPVAKSCFHLSSDHSLILIILTADALNQEKEPILSNRHTNGDDFRHLINDRLTLNIPLKTKEDNEAAVKFFNGTMQCTGWNAKKQRTEEKRRLRTDWHHL